MTAKPESWTARLCSESPAELVATLQEMSSDTGITGCTAATIRLAESRSDDVRQWAAEALENSITPTLEDVDELAEMLFSAEGGEIAYWSATMLGRLGESLGSNSKTAVAALEFCVGDSMYLPARERAVWALTQIGPPAASAALTLRRTAEDAPPRLQRLVEKALLMLGDAA
ncbi:hypothetical protein K227x_28000 [Rubripirellula lacrimiformis]|uniref:HEAT repeat protein n=1 Tax=Rubripirellula lacrimiformis TaxID=1930273 RepID=A0A517NB94_9BACT|nr:hypothetical protein [Rubripirellula lacrimiformis]QDT04409.1 hypothetical protein K227x_28000 [Rubripirellula lacrimiformis]